VVEQPGATESARRAFAAAGVADRAEATPGSFFDALPPGAGGYVLSLVIHNWSDDAARRILRRCAEGAGKDGSVFVVERTGADGRSTHTGMDLRMLTWFGGKERDLEELGALAQEAGLRVAAVHPAGELSITELVAA
jgi:O-methyltransferase domain